MTCATCPDPHGTALRDDRRDTGVAAVRPVFERAGVRGFIPLFGVAVLNSMVLISAINELRTEGTDLHEAITAGCERRLRPALMTALVAILGLAPMLIATGPGSEVQSRLRR